MDNELWHFVESHIWSFTFDSVTETKTGTPLVPRDYAVFLCSTSMKLGMNCSLCLIAEGRDLTSLAIERSMGTIGKIEISSSNSDVSMKL